jgi:hypothetical protein
MKLNSVMAAVIVSVISLLAGAIAGGLFLGGLFSGPVAGSITARNTLTHRAFTVAATNDEWTQTNIKVSPGDLIITNEPGNKITVSKSLDPSGANGIGDN